VADQLAKQPFGACPDLELIAAFVDGRLTRRERKRVEDHLSACEDCYFLFTESSRVKSQRPERSKVVPMWRKALIPVAGLAAVAALTLTVQPLVMQWLRPSNRQLAELVAAVGTQRTFEPRLTGGFKYGPVRGPVRAGESVAQIQSPEVRIAAAKIEQEASVHRTPQALRSLGLAYLVTGDVNSAVPALEEAADQPTPGAQILSDLAAAYLIRATHNNHPQDLAKALTMADRAVKTDRMLAEAWFNRAYALEQLSLTPEARRAWQDYLKVDDKSGWSDEARVHLRALGAMPQSRGTVDNQREIDAAARRRDVGAVRALVIRSPDGVRDWLQDQLLGVWSRAVLDGRLTAATESLAISTLVGQELTAATGDRFMIDAIQAAMAAGTNTAQAEALARAHEAFQAASHDYDEDRIHESVDQFDISLKPLDRSRSPFAVWARLFLAIGQYVAGDFRSAQRALDPVIAVAQNRQYTRLLGLAHRMRGLIRGVTADFAAALEEHRAALTCFDRVRDVESAAQMHASLAEDLDFLGETDLAWFERFASLSQLQLVSNRRRRHAILQLASLAAADQGLPEAALYFQHATLENAEQWGRPLAIFDAHLYQSEIQRQIGNADLAISELRDARSTLARVSDPQLVARNEAQIELEQGEVEWQRQPAAAVEALSKALTLFERMDTTWPLVQVWLALGRAHLAAGRGDLAEADFAAGIEVFERQRASVTSEALRSAAFERPWDLFSEMIHFQAVNRRRPDRALAFAEQARARTLLEASSRFASAVPVDPTRARTDIPSSVTMLYYAALDDRLLIWTISRSRLDFADTSVRQTELIHLLEEYRLEMTGSRADGRDTPSLKRLYDILIRPVSAALPDGTELVVVPDRMLHAVPFAALIRREDRRYLVEDHAVEVTPSLTLFLAASANQSTPPSGWGSALVMGDPRIDGDGALTTADLPEAEEEAREIATLYRDSVLFLGPNATKKEFVEKAGLYEVVHFAGHAIVNEGHPELSRLLMAGADETTRSLFARDIATQSFSATRLVVLGACRTSAGRIRRGEGVFSLARPFLAAGVPTVVASLWDVNDRASRRLLVAFHRSLGRSGTVTEAMRQAQLELIGSPDPFLQSPAAWAGFAVIGGRNEVSPAGQKQSE
jgi:CHAT domain-containing protein